LTEDLYSRFVLEKWHEYPEDVSFSNRHLARYAWVVRNTSYCETILDVGCGTGYGSLLLRSGCSYVKGIDKSTEAIKYATSHYTFPTLEFECEDFENPSYGEEEDFLKFRSEYHKYDVVAMIESLEHMRDMDVAMHRVFQVLKPTGRLFLTMPVKSLNGELLHPSHQIEYSEHQLSGLLKSYFSSYKFVLPEQYGVMPYKGRRFIMCVAEGPRLNFMEEIPFDGN